MGLAGDGLPASGTDALRDAPFLRGRHWAGRGQDRGKTFFFCGHPRQGEVPEGEEPADDGEERDGRDSEEDENAGEAMGKGIDACEEAGEQEERREGEERHGQQACDNGEPETTAGLLQQAGGIGLGETFCLLIESVHGRVTSLQRMD